MVLSGVIVEGVVRGCEALPKKIQQQNPSAPVLLGEGA